MLSLNIFLPASIQFGIFIRLSLNFEHCVQRLDTQSTTGVLGWCHAVPFWTPTIKGTIRAYFTQVKKKREAERWSYRADVPHHACGSGSDCRKSPFLHTQSRGRPPGGNHTDAWGGPKTPLESRASAVTVWTLPMIPWPYEGDRLNKGQKRGLHTQTFESYSDFYCVGFQRKV